MSGNATGFRQVALPVSDAFAVAVALILMLLIPIVVANQSGILPLVYEAVTSFLDVSTSTVTSGSVMVTWWTSWSLAYSRARALATAAKSVVGAAMRNALAPASAAASMARCASAFVALTIP